MNRIPKWALVAAGVLFAIVAVSFVTRHSSLATQKGSAQATYYCPMHPTYISDQPGNCPICSMKLVKRESQPPAGQARAQQPQDAKDICYMHTCPMMKPGQKCPMLVLAKAGEKVTCPVCGTHVAEAATTTASSKKILYWTDPMIPGYKADGPGKSPMGMDLVPVYEEEMPSPSAANPEGYAPILLTPEKQQLVGVTSAPSARRATTKTIRAVGVIAHDPELYQAQQEFLQAQQTWQKIQARNGIPEVVEQAKQMADASRLRLRHLGLSNDMIDEIGAWTQPDHRLILGGAGQFWVYASIYEYELSLVRAGQTAAIVVDAFPGHAFAGTVKAIDPMLDAATRTTRVRILVDDPDGILKPEMFVNVSIAADLGTILTVPHEAVFSTGQRNIVFVDRGQGLFEPRQVTTGVTADGYTEIKDGLSEGERVVTSGNFLIDSESRLKGALQNSGGSHQHGP